MNDTHQAINWDQRVKAMRDDQLVLMCQPNASEQFLEEAISAARSEIERRNLSASELEDGMAAAKLADSERRDHGDVPLSNAAWLAFVVFGPMLMVTIAIVIMLAASGRRRQSKEAIYAIIFSLAVYGLISFLVFFFLGQGS